MNNINSKKAIIWGSIGLLAFVMLIASISNLQKSSSDVVATTESLPENPCSDDSTLSQEDVYVDLLTCETYTQDIASVEVAYVFDYDVRPENSWDLFQRFGQDYENKVINPVLNQVIKDVLGHWRAIDAIDEDNWNKINSEIEDALNERLNTTYFEDCVFEIVYINAISPSKDEILWREFKKLNKH